MPLPPQDAFPADIGEYRERILSFLGASPSNIAITSEEDLIMNLWWWKCIPTDCSEHIKNSWKMRLECNEDSHFDLSVYAKREHADFCTRYEMMVRIVLNDRPSAATYLDLDTDRILEISKVLTIPQISGRRPLFGPCGDYMPWPRWDYNLAVATNQQILDNFKRYIDFCRRSLGKAEPVAARTTKPSSYEPLEIWDKQRFLRESPRAQAANITSLKKRAVENLRMIAQHFRESRTTNPPTGALPQSQ